MSASKSSLTLAALALSGVAIAALTGLDGVGLVAIWAGMAVTVLGMSAAIRAVQPAPAPIPVRVPATRRDPRQG